MSGRGELRPPGGGQTEYYKLSGAGNDFLALVEPPAPPGGDQIRAWCRRGLSLGADGLFSIIRESGGGGGGNRVVRMVHYNADGGRSDLCLNGSRCAAALAFHLGWAEEELLLATDAGTLRARDVGASRVAVELPDIVGGAEPRTLTALGEDHAGWLLTVGVPHFVLPWPGGLAGAPVARLGKALRAHPDLGDAGANVNFVRYLPSAGAGDPDRCQLRTFERGVEAETLACGTGVVATVAAGIVASRLGKRVAALTAGGYELTVEAGDDGGPWVLEGDARIVAYGELRDGASAVPAPPGWE